MFKKFVAAALTVAVGLTGSAGAQEVDFSGETIEMIVPYGEGGGQTVHARILAPLLEQELPGNPTIIIRNIEGGGSLIGINQFAQRAQPDGLMIGSLGASAFYRHILDDPRMEFNLPGFRPFLASPYGLVAYGRTDYGLTGDPIHDLELMQEEPPIYGGSGPTGSDMPVLYCLDLLDVDIRPVWGLSRGEARQAMLRGETEINYDNLALIDSDVKPMVDDGTAIPIFTLGYLDEDGTIGRDPKLPDTPTCPELYEMANGEELSGAQRDAYRSLFSIRMGVAKALVLPEGTPDDILQTYYDAMTRVVERPELQEDAVQVELGGYEQLAGEAALAPFVDASDLDPATVDELLGWLDETWDFQPEE